MYVFNMIITTQSSVCVKERGK
jgi:ABC-type nickel/cobalt efflux system permease component RcnA